MAGPGRENLNAVLQGYLHCEIAVSGGVDSVTLAAAAFETLGRSRVGLLHAVSPAVPKSATARLKALAKKCDWTLRLIDAGEFADPRYRANPINRCFFCKTNLYSTMRSFTSGTLLSGTNLDDLSDFRPGLAAAEAHGVRHPFVEAGMAKADVRLVALELGLDEFADLPASPCLSSRVETGLAIMPNELGLVDSIEQHLRKMLVQGNIRCRVRREGFVLELDAKSLACLDAKDRARIASHLKAEILGKDEARTISFAPYKRGSAFLSYATDAGA